MVDWIEEKSFRGEEEINSWVILQQNGINSKIFMGLDNSLTESTKEFNDTKNSIGEIIEDEEADKL